MNQAVLENYIKEGFSTYKIAIAENCSQTNVRYWLKKYGLHTRKNQAEACLICNSPLSGNQTKFCSRKCHNQSGNARHQNYECQQKRGLKRKLDLIGLRGSKCEICGYSKNLAALQFHHLDPNIKESQMDMRKLSNSKWEWCLNELDKCQVLCSNCHAETHFPHLSLEIVGADFDH